MKTIEDIIEGMLRSTASNYSVVGEKVNLLDYRVGSAAFKARLVKECDGQEAKEKNSERLRDWRKSEERRID